MQAVNPYLPNWEYIPDGEPYVFDDRVYVFGSHDRFDGTEYCQNDYAGWSAPVTDLSDWRFEGIIFRCAQDPDSTPGRYMNAPDVQKGPDGRYYLYYFLGGGASFMGVAVCDTPAGKYEYYGKVSHPDGTWLGMKKGDPYVFDPGMYMDDDGKIYLYFGFSPSADRRSPEDFGEGTLLDGGYVVELAQDMLTMITTPKLIAPGQATPHAGGFEGHEFFEASSMRKIGGRYYFVYSSVNSHELCYAISDKPDGFFQYGGTLISNGDVYLNGDSFDDGVNAMGNTHGGLLELDGKVYVFYHRQTNRHQVSRQGCAERVYIEPDGSIKQVPITSCGLNDGPLVGKGEYQAYIACNLWGKDGIQYYLMTKVPMEDYPYLTQDGVDRDHTPNQYVANLCDGGTVGYKYFEFCGDLSSIAVNLRGKGQGYLDVLIAKDAAPIASIPFSVDSSEWQEFSATFCVPEGVYPVYFVGRMEGRVDFFSFEFKV